MSTFLTGVANPMSETIAPPKGDPHGIFSGPRYGLKRDHPILLGQKFNKPVRNKGTKTRGAEASVN
tara:strand:- start:383 stop:580 length:198 start_codon:yes stop_codon:yes gene_type:complete